MQRLLGWLRISLKIALVVTGLVLVARAAMGPFRLGVSVRNPIGAESTFAVSAVVLLLSRVMAPRGSAPPLVADLPETATGLRVWHAFVIAIGVGLAAWAWNFRFPFVADDYPHTANALQATAAYLAGLFTVPAGDHFFRPFGYLSYAAEAYLFGLNRVPWHVVSLGLHVLNALLVFYIARNMRIGSYAALGAMMFFLLHGSRPEAVAWVSAQFDLWAAFFVLIALSAFLRYRETGSQKWNAIALAALLCGLLSKESAYVFPLVIVFLLRITALRWRETFRLAAPSLAMTAVVFVYRWFLLGGIGGYSDASSGTSFFYNVSLFRSAKGLFGRSLAITLFPMNWSAPHEWWLSAALFIGVTAIVAVAVWEPCRKRIAGTALWFGAGFFLISAAPVHQFLLIDADLEKSRVLYLPMAGAALVLAALLDSLKAKWAIAFAAAVIVFQAAALEHNLLIWKNVAELAETTCSMAAKDLFASPGPVRMTGIPNVLDGVYFLHTGFRKCVERAAGRDMLPGLSTDTDPLITVEAPPTGEPVRNFRWDGNLRRLVEETGAEKPTL